MDVQALYELPWWLRLLQVFWPVLALLAVAWLWSVLEVRGLRTGGKEPNPARRSGWWDDNDDDQPGAGVPPGAP